MVDHSIRPLTDDEAQRKRKQDEQFAAFDRQYNVGGEARLAAHQPSHTTTATPQGVASTDQLGGRTEEHTDG